MFCPECGVAYTDAQQEKCLACGTVLKKDNMTENTQEAAPVAGAEGVNLAHAEQEYSAVKKKSGKKVLLVTLGIIVGVLVISGVVGFAFFRTQIKMMIMPASQVYSEIESSSISNGASSVVAFKLDPAKNVKTSMELSIDNIEGQVFPTDLLAKLKDLKMVVNTEIDQPTLTGNVDVSMMQGVDELFKAAASADQSKIGFNIPAMDANYYTADYTKIRDYLLTSGTFSQSPLQGFLKGAGLTEQQFSDLLVGYGKEIMINNVDKNAIEYNKDTTTEIEGVKYSNITVTYTGATLKKTVLALANKIKSDTVLKKALYTFVTNNLAQTASLAGSFGATESPTISEVEFNQGIDEAMDQVTTIPDSVFGMIALKHTVFIDGNEKIVGRALDITSPSMGSAAARIMFSNVNQNGSDLQSMTASVSGMRLLTFKNKTTGNKSEGSIVSSIPNTFDFNLTYVLEKKDAQGMPEMVGNITLAAKISTPSYDPKTYASTTIDQKLDLKIDATEVTAGTEYLTKIVGSFDSNNDKSSIGISLRSKYAPFTVGFKPLISTSTTVDAMTMDPKVFQKDLEKKAFAKLTPFMESFQDLMPSNN